MRARRIQILAASAIGIAASAIAPALSLAHVRVPLGPPPVDARVAGVFQMWARVTTAVGVRGEHTHQLLKRRWAFTPESCSGSICATLQLDRERSAGLHELLTLRRVTVGTYVGEGSFYAALRCGHRIYPRGSRVPYRITLRVRAVTTVQGIAFAQRITATYRNRERFDSTPCALGPSHDAARYSGIAIPASASPSATALIL
jgi:hypothetical protein